MCLRQHIESYPAVLILGMMLLTEVKTTGLDPCVETCFFSIAPGYLIVNILLILKKCKISIPGS